MSQPKVMAIWIVGVAMCSMLVACNSSTSTVDVPPQTMAAQDQNSGTSMLKIRLKPVMTDVNFEQPLFLTQSPGDNENYYVVEKNGKIFQLREQAGAWRKQLFLDISNEVEAGASEAGLLSMAFDPDYRTNGYLYVSYTASPSKKSNADSALESRLVRFQFRQNAVDKASQKLILALDQPYANHNGGHLAFSPQGYLMWGLGDGGSGGDPSGNGQNKNSLLGSLLRLDVKQLPYRIPEDNPYAKGGGRKEIYAIGLRNPWRFSFDRNSGQLWLADVGQNNWEEIDLVNLGDNLGWNGKEGSHCYVHDLCENSHYKDPILEYDHSSGNCSVTGGYVYRGSAYPQLRGIYFYGDFCSGIVSAVTQSGDGSYRSLPVLNSGLNIASFAEDNNGELYILHLGGSIHRIEAIR